MVLPTIFNEVYIHLFSFFGWRDIVEILFFSTLFYCFSLWLSTDTKKNLLVAFYGYWCVAFAAYGLQLPTITFFLFICSPLALMLFILVHQEFLQRNFITLKNNNLALARTDDWLELLLRVCLQTINKNKEILVVVEQEDKLQDVFTVPFNIDTNLDQAFLTLLIEGKSFDHTKFIWINGQGKLLGINATWKNSIHQEWFDKNVQAMEQWKQDALALTHKTDALIFGATSSSRTFSVIHQGKLLEPLQGVSALRLLKKLLALSSDYKKGISYDYSQQSTHNQTRP